LQHICCQTKSVFLICWCFFYLHAFSSVAEQKTQAIYWDQNITDTLLSLASKQPLRTP